LNIYTRERYQFTKDQLRVLRALADYAALAVHNARLYEDCMQARAEVAAWQEHTDKAREAAKNLHEVIRLVAELAAQAMGADGGALVLPDVKLLAGMETPNLPAADLATLPGIELLAREVQQRRHPLILEDVQALPAGQHLREAGVAACLAVPLPTQEDMNAVLCVYSRSAREFGAREYALLSSFAAQAATIIENQRLLQDAHLRLEEMNTLLEVSQSIVSKLDPEAVFDRIIQHGSRIMQAEVCSLLLVDRQTGELRVAAARGLDEQHVQRLRLSQGEGVIGAVLRDGQARAVTDIRRHPNFIYQDVTEPQGLRALLCVPLQTAEEVLGVLNIYRSTAHTWSDAEVKFLSALGVQAAIAIENATLYQQEHQIAQALQKAFVPVHPPAVTGLEIGRVYVPANAQGEVGGDYYDFIPLDGGRLGFVIADVSGKGLRAATDTAMGKYVLRAYMLEDPLPGEVVRRTNNALRRQFQEDSSFLTLFYGLWDSEARRLAFVNAGHPYPLLWQREEQSCVRLRSDRTMLLGIMEDADFTEQALHIKPGDVLLTYTDGVIEARRGNELFGMARLEKILNELAAEPAQTIADEIYRRVCQFRDEPRSDDVTLVVMKFVG
ncbi:MAG TPA: GAF domain-containing SpoIIE family protein phosphatase, partial [Armatimonadota bacterium]|nr:GAF domain-containing SpoIIE family protein phosphatase [Armatimonadota bacterium]